MAGISREELPFGMWVTSTTVSEMNPGTDRSIPRCWTTSVWPTAASISTAANGQSAARALAPRLPGWKIALSANSSPVATQIPADRRQRAAVRPAAAALPAVARPPAARSRCHP